MRATAGGAGAGMSAFHRAEQATIMRRVISNAASILASDAANRASTFALYAMVARFLGVVEFGQLSIALTLFYTFQIFAVAGLKTLTLREVASDRTRTTVYLVNGSLVALLTASISLALTFALVRALDYSRDTAWVILALAVGLIPFALAAVCEAIFQAWEKMHFVAYANVPVNLVKIGLAFSLLSAGAGLRDIVVVLVGAVFAILLIDWWLVVRHVARPRFVLDLSVARSIVTSTRTFLGIDGIIAVTGSMNVVLLSKFAGEREVGFYTAAVQVMVPITLLYQSLVLSLFPAMCRRFEPTFRGLKSISERLLELLLSLALPTAVGLFVLAEPVLALLYGGEELLRSALALRIMIWGVILYAFTHVLGQALLASRREKTTLRIVTIDAAVTLVTGLVLISQFGYVGAAVTALITRIVDMLQHYVPVSRLFNSIPLGQLTWKPVLATGFMFVTLDLLRGQGLAVQIPVAALIYIATLLSVAVWSAGGRAGLRARYLWLD